VRKRDFARRLPLQHEAARERIARAWAAQGERATRHEGVARTNARLVPADLERVAPLDACTRRRMLDAVAQLGLSARGYHRVWRLARTLADLAGDDDVGERAIGEALSMRGPSAGE
jgi:magnesium chelatase family protein